jgi:phage regulator Rha-like protein
MQILDVKHHAGNTATMSSREIAELVGSRHSDVMRTIDRLVEKNVISGCAPSAYTHEQNGQPYAQYLVTKRDSFVVVAQLCPEFTARLVDRWQELESQLAQPITLPSYAETLRLYADQIEQTQRVTVERDNAITTKALIGSKREATAMATASQAVKKANSLERELDRAKDYCTVKRMSMVHHGQPFDWRALKSASNEMGIESIDVFDQNYGTVKAYHSSAWCEVYGLSVGGEC